MNKKHFKQKMNDAFSKSKKFLSSPEKFFLLFAGVIGLILVFLTPPMQVPDEQTHLYRAYQVSNLDLAVHSQTNKDGKVEYGVQLPKSVFDAATAFMSNVGGHPDIEFRKGLYKEYIGQPLEASKTEFVQNSAGYVYSPIIYAPQSVGINIGKLFNASPLIIIWLGRLANLALWLGLVYATLRLIPFAKWGVVIFALNPMMVFLASSLSPDVVNIGFAFLLFGLVMSCFKDREQISKQKIIAMIAVLGVLALSKPVNLLFGLLLFLIPFYKFTSWKKRTLFIVGGLLVAGVLFLGWNLQIKPVLDAAVNIQAPTGLHVSPTDQLKFILHSPLHYVKMIIQNYVINVPGTPGDAVLVTFFGVFGWLDTNIPMWTILLYFATLLVAIAYQLGRGTVIPMKAKLFLIALFALSFVGTITAMYFNATPVGNFFIQGVQGRYFIGATILLFAVFTMKKKILNVTNEGLALFFAGSMAVIFLTMLLRIALRYYS